MRLPAPVSKPIAPPPAKLPVAIIVATSASETVLATAMPPPLVAA